MPDNKVAYIIFSNDWPHFVCLDNLGEAGIKLEELAQSHYSTNKWDDFGHAWTYEEYKKHYNWHIREVPTDEVR